MNTISNKNMLFIRSLILFFSVLTFGLYSQNTKLESYGLKGKVKSIEIHTLDSVSYKGEDFINYESRFEVYFNDKGYVTHRVHPTWNTKEKLIYDKNNNCIAIENLKFDTLIYKTFLKKEDTIIKYSVFDYTTTHKLFEGIHKVDKLDRLYYTETTYNNDETSFYHEIITLRYDEYSQPIYHLISSKVESTDGENKEPLNVGGEIENEYLKFDKKGNWIRCSNKNINGPLSTDIKRYVIRKINY